jgi:NAD(P)H-dependent FMN reductase
MNTPALTWRLRRIKRTLWPSLRDGSRSQWLAEHVRRRAAEASERSSGESALRRTWLAALRLDERIDYAARAQANQPG